MKNPDYTRREFIEFITMGTAAVALPAWFFTPEKGMSTQVNPAVSPVPFTQIRFRDSFWAPRIETNRKVTIPYDFQKCEETGRIDNFAKAGGLMEGEFRGLRYDDSDVFKVMEGAAYSLSLQPDAKLEEYLEAVITKVAAAQEPDGYLYTARTLRPNNPVDGAGDKRWSFLKESHELYNIGHMYEAAVAHFQATGRRTFLDVAIRNADLIDSTFGPDKLRAVPGHQEIEIGLVKLFRVTGDRRYLDLAKFFLDERGRANGRELYGEYNQDHLPVTQQAEAVGHAVRAGYMYTGMADVAALTGDHAYIEAIDRIWNDVVTRKLYITGGIGSSRSGEAFGDGYDLPNRTAYNETCAAIANAMWNHRMFLLHGDARYIDVLERVIYNGFLSGISLSGDRFFYPNPLESNGRYLFNHGAAERQPWFGTSCCPVNVARFVPSIAGFMYGVRGNDVFVNLYAEGDAVIKQERGSVRIIQETRYPWDEHVQLTLQPEHSGSFAVHVRIPGWAMSVPAPGGLYRFLDVARKEVVLKVNGESAPLQMEKGFAVLNREWKNDDTIDLLLPMPVRRVVADPRVKANVERVALQRGPLVYCIEGVDHQGKALNLIVPDDSNFVVDHRPDLLGGVSVLRGKGFKVERSSDLEGIEVIESDLVAIPYYAWNHRGVGEMAVWLPRTPDVVVLPPLPTIASTSITSASHIWDSDSIHAVNDQEEPQNSHDRTIPRFTWWDHRGTPEWIQYDFTAASRISAVEVYWYDDAPRGGCRVPESWQVSYRSGNTWKPIVAKTKYGVEKDQYNRVSFESVTTDGLKLEVQLQSEFSAGILEWKVEEDNV